MNAKSTEKQLTPLLCAVKKGYLDIVKLLLSDERCDPSITSLDDTNILIFACQSNNLELLDMILSTSGQTLINSQNANGDTPLHFACRSDNFRIVEILLDKAEMMEDVVLNINAQNKEGDTPIHLVCRNNNTKILSMIIEKVFTSRKLSIDSSVKNNRGEAPLHLAAH